MPPLFSVIIPVYNDEGNIRRCLQSVIHQQGPPIEIIVINDGSTDNSPRIISEYANHNNVTIINQDNRGVSVARNVGISISIGDYLVFIDSDDWIDQGYLNYISEKITLNNNVDGIILGYYHHSQSVQQKRTPKIKKPILSRHDYGIEFLKGRIQNCPWDKIFKRRNYINNGIWYPEGISMAEDAIVTAQIGMSAKSVIICNDAFLHYSHNPSGATKSEINTEKIGGTIRSMSIISTIYSKHYPQNLISAMVFRQLFYYAVTSRSTPSRNLPFDDIWTFTLSHMHSSDQPTNKWKIYALLCKLLKHHSLHFIIKIFYACARFARHFSTRN